MTNSTISGNTSDAINYRRGSGGIFNNGGQVEVSDSTFSGNESESFGGGVYNTLYGTLTVKDSTFSGNRASFTGGGILNGGTLTVTNSTISGNSANDAVGSSGSGGGIDNGGTLEVSGSTISGNYANSYGGGIANGGPLTVTNSSLSGNEALSGGGLENCGGDVALANSTFSGNRATNPELGGGGISMNSPSFCFGVDTGTVTLRSTIVANSTEGGNCVGNPITDGGYNVDDDGTCSFTQATGSLSNTDPLLDPEGLQNNGGPTKTIALLPNSPAVDLVGQDACPPPQTDQRGVARPQGEACDSGAFELEQQADPKTKAECKRGGYKQFGFKNQGRCIAFVNRAAHGQ